MKRLLEIACFDLASARTAAKAGAHRIEFCAGLHEGGTTPLLHETKTLLSETRIPVFVMIRVRGGDFVYSNNEFLQMQTDLQAFRDAGVHGFVFGCLNKDHSVNEEMNGVLLELAGGLPCTFHRAVDHTPDLFAAVKKLGGMGFSRVLTSGGKGHAADNIAVLMELARQNTIGILPGGGVRSTNIRELLPINTAEFHSSGITTHSNGKADVGEIKKILDALH